MITAAASRLVTGPCLSRQPGFDARAAVATWPRRDPAETPAARGRTPAPSPGARDLAASLQDVLGDCEPAPAAALAAAAARGFSAGNGYLTGQIVDRST